MDSLFKELKRRNVVRVGVAYLALVWVVLQVTDMAVPALNLPESLISIVFYLGAMGFPFALFFAWAFELTPEGLMKTEDVDASSSVTHSTGRKLNFVIIGLLVVAVSWLTIDRFTGNEAVELLADITTEPIEKSIAVLPFVAMSSGEEDGYFADGLTEELLNSLAQLSELKVAARTSSFYYKGKDLDLRQVGEELGVAHILEGSIRRSGNRIRVTAQLVEAEDGFHLWSANFDRDMSDIFLIQDEISREVTNALRIELLGEEARELEQHGTNNAEAQNLYLIATARLRELQRPGANLQADPVPAGRMHALFEEVTRIDPNYADAWAGLSEARLLLGRNGLTENTGILLTRDDGIEQAQVALNRAIALAPNAEPALLAAATLGYQRYSRRGINRTEAELAAVLSAFQRILEINPNSISTLESLARILREQGSFQESLDLWDRVLVLDPLSPAMLERAEALFHFNPDEAYRQAKRVGDLHPDSSWREYLSFSEALRNHLHHSVVWSRSLGTEDSSGAWGLSIVLMSLGDDEAAYAAMNTQTARSGGSLGDVIERNAAIYRREYEQVISSESARQLEGGQFIAFTNLIPALFRLRRFDEVMAQADSFYASLETSDLKTRLNGRIEDPRPLYEIAHALQETGDVARAKLVRDNLREKVHAKLNRENWRDSVRYHEGELMLLASEGRTEEALDEFEAMVEEGWRILVGPNNNTVSGEYYSFFLFRFDDNPILDSLRDEPRFIATLEFVKAENAAMLAELNAGLSIEDILDEDYMGEIN